MENTNVQISEAAPEQEKKSFSEKFMSFMGKTKQFFKKCWHNFIHMKPRTIADIIVWVALFAGAVVVMIPFVWMVLSTFKPGVELYNDAFFPKKWTAVAYGDMWKNAVALTQCSMPRGFLNSVITTVPVVLVQVFVSAMAAYAFAKLDFKGKNVLFLVMLSTMMIPFAVVMLPQAWLYGRLGLTNGPLAVMIPKMFGAVGTVFFLRQFLYGIPKSISEAALLDGAGYMRIFTSIILPLIMPALSTQFILSFIGNWNDYLGPLLFINQPAWRTLPLVVDRLNPGAHGADMERIPQALAASLVSLIPIIVVFAIFQKKIIGSIVFSAVKG
ncbi:MAG: carbohydrate ABC transporter permease [Clostridia bacterium]|jgi:multiple sugar transport system permease protein|nr:carbohydrate ABC transporter permease [Clostridia bacterium]